MVTLAKVPQARRPWKRLTAEEVSDIRRLSAEGASVSELARRFGSGWATIRDAIRGSGAYSEAKAERRRARTMAGGNDPAPVVKDFTDEAGPTEVPDSGTCPSLASGDDAGPKASGVAADPAPMSTLARLEEARARVGKAGKAELPAARFAFVVAQASHYEFLFHDSEDSLKEAKTPASKRLATERRDEAYRRYLTARRYCP